MDVSSSDLPSESKRQLSTQHSSSMSLHIPLQCVQIQPSPSYPAPTLHLVLFWSYLAWQMAPSILLSFQSKNQLD